MNDATTDLQRATALFVETFPDARCELWDYDAKIKCGVHRGETIEVRFSRDGLSDDHIMKQVDRLADKVKAAG